MPEKLVIQEDPSGSRIYISRVRVVTPNAGATDVGYALREKIRHLPGVDKVEDFGHKLQVRLVHPALWDWDEVEPAIAAAFAELIGEPEIIREVLGQNCLPVQEGRKDAVALIRAGASARAAELEDQGREQEYDQPD